MTSALKVVIVDDEPLAHTVLQHHLAAHADVALAGQCYSAAEAMALLAQQPVDLLLLDIQLPVLSGLDMLRLLAKPPQVVLTTAYAEYALDGFQLDVTDYLLKPVSAERFAEAMMKVRRRLAAAVPAQAPQPVLMAEPVASPVAGSAPTSLLLKVDRGWRRFDAGQICCFEGYGNYVKVWHGSDMTLASITLKAIYQQTAALGFVQVHKSFVVNPAHVRQFDSQQLQLSNQLQIRLGEAFKQQARQQLLKNLS